MAQPGRTRADRAAPRQATCFVDGAALPAALGHDPAEAPLWAKERSLAAIQT
jgi:hypothetical protein